VATSIFVCGVVLQSVPAGVTNVTTHYSTKHISLLM